MRINALGNTATDFASDDYIAIDGTTNGSRKLKNDTLSKLMAQAALAGNIAEAFDPTRTNTNPYLPNQWVVKDGLLYKVKNEHYGAWVAADFTRANIYDLVCDSFFATSVLPYDVLKNKYVNSSGSLVSDTHFDTFVFEVIEGDYVSFTAATGGGYIEFVDSSFNLVGSAFKLGNSYTLVNYLFYNVPSGASYIRITSYNRDVGKPTLVVHKNGAFDIGLYNKLKDLKDKELYLQDSLLKSASSIIAPVNRTFKNLFSNDQVGNFAINRSDGMLNPVNNFPIFKAAIIRVTAGNYTISGYEDYKRWCVGLWDKDFTRIAVKTDQMTSDPNGLITIPVGETWGSASKINVSVPYDCYLIINFYEWDTKWQTAKIQIESGTEATTYQEGVKLLPYYATLKELNDVATKRFLSGKKILIIGDSLTSLETYTDPLEANYGCYVYNRGVSGTCVSIRTGYNSSFCERFDLAENNNKGPSANGFPNRSNVDAVIVWGGINDWGHSVPLGTLEGVVDKETLFGAYKYLLEGLKTRYYGKPIIVCSVHNSARSTLFLNWNRATFNVDGSFTFRTNSQGKMLSDYHDTQKAVCDILGVTFVDMFECGVSFMSDYDLNNYSYVQGTPPVPDGLHFNSDGGEIVARYLSTKIADAMN